MLCPHTPATHRQNLGEHRDIEEMPRGLSQAWLSLRGLSCPHRDQLYLIVLACHIKSCSCLQDLFSILPGVGGLFSVFHNWDFTCVLYITANLYFSYLNHCSFYFSKSKDYRQIMQRHIYRPACLSICICSHCVCGQTDFIFNFHEMYNSY